MTCPIDNKPLTRSWTGRPPVYCSVTCRNKARAWREALPALRDSLVWWQNQAARFPGDRVYRFRENASELAAMIERFERATTTKETDE